MKSHGALVFAAVLAWTAGGAQTASPVGRAPKLRTAPTDRWGRPVLADGKRVNHLTAAVEAPLVGVAAVGNHDVPLDATGPLSVTSEWHRSTFGTGIGATGLHVVDLAGSGQKKVIATASPWGFGGNRFWYVLAYQGGEYAHEWVSSPYSQDIKALHVANLDGDAALEVVVAVGSQIYVYDGGTHALQWSFSTAASEINAIAVADVDSDGQVEVTLVDSAALFVYNATTGTQEYASSPGLGGVDLAVGNVDLDGAREIVIGNDSSTGFVVDGQTHAVEWSNPWGFGTHVRLGDVDADGRAEVVAGYAWYQIRIFDVEIQSLAASVSVDLDIDALQVVDVEGDGPLEIVYGDGQWGRVWVLNGATRVVKWFVDNPEHGITDIAFGDADADGTTELLWGAGYSSTGEDHLYVVNAATQVQEWESTDVNGPFRALSWGDVDADGQPEILSGSFESNSGYGDGLWFVHDARTHVQEYQSSPPTGSNWTGLTRIRNADVDADPQQEVFITTSQAYTGFIICYDGVSHAEQWRAGIPDGLTFASLEIEDVDLDGSLELVAGVYVEHTGAPGVFVFVLDAATGAQEWTSPSLAGSWANLALLRLANVDADPQPEILVGDIGGGLYMLDPVTHATSHLGFHDLAALATPDRNRDGVAEIVIGSQTGAIQVLNTGGTVVQTVGNFGGRIDGLAIVDLDADRNSDYAYALNGEVFMRSGADGSILWRSGLLGDGVGVEDSLHIADVDEDGAKELLVNIGSTGFRLYGIISDRIFTDGFE